MFPQNTPTSTNLQALLDLDSQPHPRRQVLLLPRNYYPTYYRTPPTCRHC